MHLSQIVTGDGRVAVVARFDEAAAVVAGAASVRDLALDAMERARTLIEVVAERGLGQAVDLAAVAADGRFLPPLTHPDPAHLHLTGTGLTHLGSASTRDAMHAKADAEDATDSLRMFRMGLEGGKPDALPGVQPEWFYKGNGHAVAAPGAPLMSPAFALDAGEEPEIAGLYVVSERGEPGRVGWALGNEFSDHVTERINYLFLAHSKLRPCSYGPEILVGDLPADIRGASRVRRGDAVVWEKPFLSGEANMSHSFANLEHHHFKYPIFRQPGDVHVHFFGTATLSFADGFRAEPGDVWEIEAAPFGLPLRNPLAIGPDEGVAAVRQL